VSDVLKDFFYICPECGSFSFTDKDKKNKECIDCGGWYQVYQRETVHEGDYPTNKVISSLDNKSRNLR